MERSGQTATGLHQALVKRLAKHELVIGHIQARAQRTMPDVNFALPKNLILKANCPESDTCKGDCDQLSVDIESLLSLPRCVKHPPDGPKHHPK